MSPFFTTDVIGAIEESLQGNSDLQTHGVEVQVLTRIRVEDFQSKASSLEALEELLQWPTRHPAWKVFLRAIDNIHAKVWVFDEDLAFVGSGNATHSGLENNIEYGLAVKDPQLVAQILTDWLCYWEEGTTISSEQLAAIRQTLEQLIADKELTTLQEASSKRRATILEDLKLSSRLGKRLPLVRSKEVQLSARFEGRASLQAGDDNGLSVSPELISQAKQLDLFAGIFEQYNTPSITHSYSVSEPRPQSLRKPLVIGLETIGVSSNDLQRAYNWLFPMTDYGRIVRWKYGYRDIRLELNWKAQSAELELIRKDKKQKSRAIVKGYCEDPSLGDRFFINEYEAYSWQDGIYWGPSGVLANGESGHLFSLKGWLPRSNKPTETNAIYSKDQEVHTSAALDTKQEDQDISTLEAGTSYVLVEHSALVDQLNQLEHNWGEQYLDLAFPRIVILTFSHLDEKPGITLSACSSNHCVEIYIPGKDGFVAEPQARFHLDYDALWQILDGTLAFVDAWYLQPSSDGKTLHLLPESYGQEDIHQWFHHLYSVE